jgi:hypothetical protein
VNACDCCGKVNLKFTVVVELDDGQVVHYGQVCAGRNTGKDRRTQTSEARAFHLEQVNAARGEFVAGDAYRAERARFAERAAARMLPGLEAAEFVRDAADAADTAARAIAAKYRGVSFWDVRG